MKPERTQKEISKESSSDVLINIWPNKILNDKRRNGDEKLQRISSLLSLNLQKSQDTFSEKSLSVRLPTIEREKYATLKTNGDEDKAFHFTPKLYIFRLGTPSQDPSNYKAFRPPTWLLFDHTIAIIWYIFSPNLSQSKRPNIPQLQWTLEYINSSKSSDTHSPFMDLLVRSIEDKLIYIYANQPPKEFLATKDNQITPFFSKKPESSSSEEKKRGPQPPPAVVRNSNPPEEIEKINSLDNLLKNYKKSESENNKELSNKLNQLRERHVVNIAQELIKLHDVEEIMDQLLEKQEFVRYSNKDSGNLVQQMFNEIKK